MGRVRSSSYGCPSLLSCSYSLTRLHHGPRKDGSRTHGPRRNGPHNLPMFRTPFLPFLLTSSLTPHPLQMQMLWNSQIRDTCVVFPTWHIHTPLHMLLSCFVITGICILYARLLRYIRIMDRRNAAAMGDGYAAVPTSANEHGNLGRMSLPNLGSRTPSPGPSGFNPRFNGTSNGGGMDQRTRVVRAGLYTVTVGVSFFVRLPSLSRFMRWGRLIGGRFW